MFGGFYTMGGCHFWEDVFFYQKWRIQRNYVSKKCRLLDNWDICRFEGSFDECRKAFIQFIDAFELPRQKGHMVVMIPGLGESKNIFKPLWRAVLKEGFLAAAINYPSTQKEIEGHVRQLEFFLTHLEDVNEVSFVTNGVGSVVLKKLFTKDSEWKKHFKIGRIVEVRPRNHGNKLLKKIGDNRFLSFFAGPMAKEIGASNIEKIPSLPKNIETGIIYGDSWLMKLAQWITGTKEDKTDLEKEKKFENTDSVLEFSCKKLNAFKCDKLTYLVTKFLTSGKF
ncbi:MAG: hypothetical protein E7018_06015 [Alphaproteobacteria bacterium]|nr:hypothetical protein [Alphaproteobacteria bacterium]